MRHQLFPATANHRFVLSSHGHLWTTVHVASTSQLFHQSRISFALGSCLWANWLIHLAPSARIISLVWSLMPIFLAQENNFRLKSETERQLPTYRLFSNTFRPWLTVIRWLVKMIAALASKNLLAGRALINVPVNTDVG